MRLRILAGLLVTAPALTLVNPAPASAGGGVCDGVARCHVVAQHDIDGNGVDDAIGIARRGADGAAEGHVLVRVLTDTGTLSSVRRKTEGWSGPLYQGSAEIQGWPGREIFVGATQGAHAQFYRSLTWFDDGLMDIDAPGRGHTWVVDASVGFNAGWLKRASDPDGDIRMRQAVRSEVGNQYRGTLRKFQWQSNEWRLLSTRRPIVRPAVAQRWAGFRVPGLARF